MYPLLIYVLAISLRNALFQVNCHTLYNLKCVTTLGSCSDMDWCRPTHLFFYIYQPV
jgi:hypothetical protein